MPDIDLHDPKYRFAERVQRLIGRGRTKHEAEEIVEFVIRTKEGLTKSELRSSVEPYCPQMEGSMEYLVAKDPKHPDRWVAQAINFDGEGEVYTVVFVGYGAEAQAREYAAWKNS